MKWFLLLLLGSAAVYASAEPIKVTILADDAYFPYCYAEGQQAKGAYPDIVRAAAATLKNYSVEVIPVPWKRGLVMMEAGEIFALMPPYKNADRPWMDYELVLFDESLVLLLNAASGIPPTAAWPEDFRGKTIGQNLGWSVMDPWKSTVKIESSNSNETALKKLEALRVDAILNDQRVILAAAKEMKANGKLRPETKFVVGPTVSRVTAYVSLTNVSAERFPYRDDFRRKMKAALQALEASGTIRKIVDSYVE